MKVRCTLDSGAEAPAAPDHRLRWDRRLILNLALLRPPECPLLNERKTSLRNLPRNDWRRSWLRERLMMMRKMMITAFSSALLRLLVVSWGLVVVVVVLQVFRFLGLIDLRRLRYDLVLDLFFNSIFIDNNATVIVLWPVMNICLVTISYQCVSKTWSP